MQFTTGFKLNPVVVYVYPNAFTNGLDALEVREYNNLNQLVSILADGKPTEYSYRPDGLRHSRKTGQSRRTHLWDGQNIVAEFAASGNVVDRFIRGINLLARQQDGSREYYLHDAHGDVTQRVSNLGVLRTYRYDAFGNEKDAVAEDSNPFRYCGEYWDSESGDVYLRARYYDSSTGRFTSEDSVRSASFKMPNGQEAEDPLSLNLYAYCHCAPVMHSDPTGKTIRSILAAIGSFTIGIGFGVMEAVTAGMSSEIESHTQMPNNAYAYMAGKIAANVAVGLIGMAVAGGGTAGGIVTSPTGVGAIAGAGVAVVGGTVAISAGKAAIVNAAELGKMLSGDIKLPDNESQIGHIFRDDDGHIPDTPENRDLLESIANDPENYLGKDMYGNDWYAKQQGDGSQVWVRSRDGTITNGGINDTPKTWNPKTGLNSPQKPKK